MDQDYLVSTNRKKRTTDDVDDPLVKSVGPSWIGLVVAVAAALACQDVVSVPGACPEFCPESSIDVRDTLLATVLASSVGTAASDTGYLRSVDPVGSYDGYLLPHEASQMQVVGPGAPVPARALMVFFRFSGNYLGGDATVRDTIRQTDSLRFTFNIVRRNTNVSGVTLALHEIPIVTDSAKTYADMDPYFQDSTLVATLQVPDSLVTGLVSVTVSPGALRHFVPDSLQSGIGLRIVSPEPAFVSLGPDTLNPAARIYRFVQLDSSAGSTRVTRSESRALYFKTFVADSANVPPPAGLTVGGLAAARAFVKLNVPTWLVDSTVVVRASLLLTPPRPTLGAPGDTFRLRVLPLGADFGPKSPLADSAYAGYGRVPVGGTDTVAIDITKILLLWRGNTLVPHTVMLGVAREIEAGSIDTFEVPGQGALTQAAIRITYGMPFRPGR